MPSANAILDTEAWLAINKSLKYLRLTTTLVHSSTLAQNKVNAWILPLGRNVYATKAGEALRGTG